MEESEIRNPKSEIPWSIILFSALLSLSPGVGAAKAKPTVRHGIGQIITGIVWELPRTVVEATMQGPPVVGTAVGLLAGASRGVKKVIEGSVETIYGLDGLIPRAGR
jgi:hypothetical protein